MATVPRRGTGFVNLQKYLGASSGKPLTEKVAGGVAGTAEQAQTGLGKASDAFKQEVQSSTFGTPEQQEQQKSILEKAQKGDAPGKLPGVTPEDVATYRGYAQARYKGPQDLGAQGVQLLGQAQEAKRLGQAVGSEQGRKELLQRFIGTPQYTSGQRRLDELILGRGPQQQLKTAQQKTLGTEQSALRQLATNKALAQQAQAQTQKFAREAQGATTPLLGDIETKLKEQLPGAQKTHEYYQDIAARQLRDGRLDPFFAKNLGLGSGEHNLYGVNAGSYMTRANAPTYTQLASPEQQASYSALSQLAGLQNTFLPTKEAYDPTKFGFDTQRFLADVESAKKGRQAQADRTMIGVSGGMISEGQPGTAEQVSLPQRIAILKQNLAGIDPMYTDPNSPYYISDYGGKANELRNLENQLSSIMGTDKLII